MDRPLSFEIRAAAVPMWSSVCPSTLLCSGESRRPPYGTRAEKIDGTLDRPLCRAWFSGRWWYGWLFVDGRYVVRVPAVGGLVNMGDRP